MTSAGDRPADGWASGRNDERERLLAECERLRHSLEQSRERHARDLVETAETAAVALELQIATTAAQVRLEMKTQWDAERELLAAQRDRAMRALGERDAEHQQALRLVEELLSHVTADRDRLRDQHEHMQASVARLESELDRLQQECDHARRLLAPADPGPSPLLSEIQHVIAAAPRKTWRPQELAPLRSRRRTG